MTMAGHCKVDFSRPTLLLVTGASRGLGRQLSIDLGRQLTAPGLILLLARHRDDLTETERLIRVQCGDRHGIATLVCDFSVPEQDASFYSKLITAFRAAHRDRTVDQALLVHNAGSLGDVSKPASEITDASQLASYFQLNLNSVVLLTSAFVSCCRDLSVTVINITSKAAVQPFPGGAFYSTGKAARDMFMRVLALEEPSLTVLNYAPGPLRTDMMKELLEKSHPDVKEHLITCPILDCDVTVARLIGILEAGAFKSGDCFDYYDEM